MEYKLYYNKNGWLCEVPPYYLKTNKQCKFIEVSEKVYNKVKENCPFITFFWKVIDNLIMIERIEQTAEMEDLYNLLKNYVDWLQEYDNELVKYYKNKILKIENDEQKMLKLNIHAAIIRQRILHVNRQLLSKTKMKLNGKTTNIKH